MVIAQITSDNRETFREYHKTAPWFGTAPEALLQGFAGLPDVQVHVLSCIQRPIPSPEKLAPNVWFHSLHVPKIGWMRTGYQGCIRAVRAKIRQLRPDIVHGQGTERDCSLGAVFAGPPCVLTIHGNMRLIAQVNRARPFSFPWLASKLESFTLPRAAGVVCITQYTQAAVSGAARKTWVVPNAVDASFFNVKPLPGERPAILCVGNICRRKNQNQFIRALDPVASQSPLRVLFLGLAPRHDAYCAEFFQLLETRPWCVYGGFADREKLKAHLSEATMLALPSLEDNCPMVVLEAMAARVPVLAAKVGGLPDLIQDEVNGLFCDPNDPASMGRSAQRLLSETRLAQGIATQAHEQAIVRFHPRTIANRHLEIYREVLSAAS